VGGVSGGSQGALLIAYADTSFLTSLYRTDANSFWAVAEFKELRPAILITPFNELELVTAMKAAAFRKLAAADEVQASSRAFRADLATGVLIRTPIPPDSYDRATALSSRLTRTLGCRTLDILHVAIALEAGAGTFFTFDKGQAKLARRAGLAIRPKR